MAKKAKKSRSRVARSAKAGAKRPVSAAGARVDRGNRANKRPPATQRDLAGRILLGSVAALATAAPLTLSEAATIDGAATPLCLLWLLLLLAWFGAAARQRVLRIRLGPVAWGLAALVAWLAVTVVATQGLAALRPSLNLLWQWVAVVVCYLLVRQVAARGEAARALLAAHIALAVLLASHGLYQQWVDAPQLQQHYEANRAAALIEAGFDPADAGARQRFENRLNTFQPTATFALTNSLAAYLAVVVLVVLLVRGARSWPLPNVVAVAAAALGILVCFYLTKSRAAWLAGGFGLVLAGVVLGRSLAPRFWKAVAAAASLLFLLAVVVMATGLYKRFLPEPPKSLAFRLQYWQATVEMIQDHPLLGVGLGNYHLFYPQYKLPEASEEIRDPHNFLFEMAATSGVPAVLLLLLALALAAREVLTEPSFPRGRESSGGSAGGLPSLACGGRSAEGQNLDRHFRAGGNPAAARQESRPPLRAEGQRIGQHDDAPLPLRDSWRLPVYLGVAAGVVLAFPLGWMTGHAPAGFVIAAAVPVLALAFCGLDRWVSAGRLSPALPAIAILVLLVNLLAAGGIQYPGLAIPLFVLMGIAVATGRRGEPLRELGGRWPWAALGIAFALGAAAYVTAYRPAVRGGAALDRGNLLVRRWQAADARVLGRPPTPSERLNWLTEARDQFLLATQADPFDSRGPQRFARNRRVAPGRRIDDRAQVQPFTRSHAPPREAATAARRGTATDRSTPH